MKTRNFLSAVVGLVVLFGAGCSNMSVMDVKKESTTVKNIGTNTVETVTEYYHDRSRIRKYHKVKETKRVREEKPVLVPVPVPVHDPWNREIIRFRATIGGGGGPYHY